MTPPSQNALSTPLSPPNLLCLCHAQPLSLFNRRKSITGNWKTNQGSAMLEQITLTEKYKSWVDEVSHRVAGMGH